MIDLYLELPLLEAGLPHQVFLGLLILGAVALYIGQWIPSETTSILVIALLAASQILTPEEVLSGFSNTATITVAAMFVLSSGLLRSGALEFVVLRMAQLARGNPSRILLLLGLLVAPASAFLNNTPIVVMMVPVVLSLCRQFDIKPSKLMIPLSFFAMLGGTCTLFGTSTNILVNDLYRDFSGRHDPAKWDGVKDLSPDGFGLFGYFTRIGLVYLGIGGAFILVVNDNFGCGSSREHAPQGLWRWGIRGVVGESFAEIFFGNCVALGMPCLTLPRAAVRDLQDRIDTEPSTRVVLDVDGSAVRVGGEALAAGLPAGVRQAFLGGTWDPTGLLMVRPAEIDKVAAALPYVSNWPFPG